MTDDTEFHLESLELQCARRAFAMVSEARRVGIPMVIISGARTAAVNAEVGGSANSFHLTGNAFDVAIVGYERDRIPFSWWQAVGLWAEGALDLYWGGRFLHRGVPDVNHFDMRRLFRSV